MKGFRNRAAEKARRAASGGDGPPAGQDPSASPGPATADRGALRKRLRHARRNRDAALHELGALVMEMHRQGRHDPALVERKAQAAIAADTEARSLAGALDWSEPLTDVGAPTAALPATAPPVAAAPPAAGDRVQAPAPSSGDRVEAPAPSSGDRVEAPAPASGDRSEAPAPSSGDRVAAPPPAAADKVAAPPAAGDRVEAAPPSSSDRVDAPPPSASDRTEPDDGVPTYSVTSP